MIAQPMGREIKARAEAFASARNVFADGSFPGLN
jgi:hypothetical protein